MQEYVEKGALPFAGGTLDQPREFWDQVDEYRAIRYALMVEALPEVRAKWDRTGRGDGTE